MSCHVIWQIYRVVIWSLFHVNSASHWKRREGLDFVFEILEGICIKWRNPLHSVNLMLWPFVASFSLFDVKLANTHWMSSWHRSPTHLTDVWVFMTILHVYISSRSCSYNWEHFSSQKVCGPYHIKLIKWRVATMHRRTSRKKSFIMDANTRLLLMEQRFRRRILFRSSESN